MFAVPPPPLPWLYDLACVASSLSLSFLICKVGAKSPTFQDYYMDQILIPRASLVAQTAKNLPAMPVTRVRYLGQEDPLENVMVSHSSILAWRIPWTVEPGGLQSMGSQRVRHN